MKLLPFDTTLYTLENNKPGSVNYLGIGRYVQYWTSLLFPQFTVLTNNPREHGFLCAIIKYLHNSSLPVNHRNIRHFEAFWGLLLTSQTEVDSPVNVTKYQKVLEKYEVMNISLKEIKKENILYNRLGYGLFGFYINPSVKWGLVKSDKKTLTGSGELLADYFLNKLGLKKTFNDWNKNIPFNFSSEKAANLAVKLQHNLDPEGLGEEKHVWIEVKESFLRHCSVEARQPWQIDLTDLDLWTLTSDSVHYKGFLETINGRYRSCGSEQLANIVQGLIYFEQALAITEFIFELEYQVRSQYKERSTRFTLSEGIKDLLITTCKKNIDQYISIAGLKNVYGPFNSSDMSYKGYLNRIIQEHIIVQRGKNKSVFMNEKEILSLDEINPGKVAVVISHDDPSSLLQELYFQYRKDWHFLRFIKYYQYMSEYGI